MSLQLYPSSSASNPSQVIANNESIYALPPYMQVARGLVPGASVVNLFGYQAAVGTSFIPVWENTTTYTYPGSAVTMYLWSSSGSDTAVQVLVSGLDGSYNLQSETVTLNGTTVVPTVNTYLRINRLDVTGTVNAVGTINIGNSGKTVEYAQINAGVGHSEMLIYTVPNGYTFYLTRVNVQSQLAGGASNYANYRVFTQFPSGLTNYVLQTPFTTDFNALRVAPFPYAGKTDIQAQVAANSSTVAVGVQWEGILISNSAS